MSELNFSESPQVSTLPRLLEGLRRLRRGQVFTVNLGKEGEPDLLIAEARKKSSKWDFQKHRLGDGSWLLHSKVSSKRG